jgi:hypothetical protein
MIQGYKIVQIRCNLVLFRNNKLKALRLILPHELFGVKNSEIVNFTFINLSRYYSYGYAKSGI